VSTFRDASDVHAGLAAVYDLDALGVHRATIDQHSVTYVTDAAHAERITHALRLQPTAPTLVVKGGALPLVTWARESDGVPIRLVWLADRAEATA
jgi:hypothetical protein